MSGRRELSVMSRVRYFRARKHEDSGFTCECSNEVTSDLPARSLGVNGGEGIKRE